MNEQKIEEDIEIKLQWFGSQKYGLKEKEMRDSLKFSREIAKKCFRINEPEDGDVIFDTKLCAKLVEEKFKSSSKKCSQSSKDELEGLVMSIENGEKGIGSITKGMIAYRLREILELLKMELEP